VLRRSAVSVARAAIQLELHLEAFELLVGQLHRQQAVFGQLGCVRLLALRERDRFSR